MGQTAEDRASLQLARQVREAAEARHQNLPRLCVRAKWRDDGRVHYNVAVLRWCGEALMIEKGHETPGSSWRNYSDFSLNYWYGGDYIQILPIPRVVGQRPVKGSDDVPGGFSSFPFFVASGWWPGLLPSTARLHWYGHPVSLVDVCMNSGYAYEEKDGMILVSKGQEDRITLDPREKMRLVERVVRPLIGPSQVRMRVFTVAMVGGCVLPRQFRLDWSDGGEVGGLEGEFSSTLDFVGDCLPDERMRSRPGTCKLDARGVVEGQIVPGGFEIMDSMAVSVRESFGGKNGVAVGVGLGVGCLVGGLGVLWSKIARAQRGRQHEPGKRALS